MTVPPVGVGVVVDGVVGGIGFVGIVGGVGLVGAVIWWLDW